MQPRMKILRKSVIISVITLLFITSCGGSFNPSDWKLQVQRRISPQILIQPDKVALFYTEMEPTTGSDPYKVSEYIESQIVYINDFFNHASMDHLPTAAEVLSSRRDDCDGQAVLLCSVLRYKGYDAYTMVGPSHAWVEVNAEETVLINYRGGDWFVKFNESSVHWRVKPLLLMVGEQFVLLTAFFFVLIYAYEAGFFLYLQEALGYFKYVLLFFFGYLLIGVLILVAKSTFWIFWLVVSVVALILIMKVAAKVRMYLHERA